MSYVSYCNGAYLPQEKISMPVDNLAFTRGYGAFELLRTYDRKPFYLEEHLERFFFSIQALHLPKLKVDCKEIIKTLLILNPTEELMFRLYCTEFQEKPLLLVLANKITPPTEDEYQKGIAIITTSLARTLVEVKSTNYLAGQVALKEAAMQNASDALFVTPQGELLELTRSNFFCMIKEKLHTPKTGILCGITRKVLLSCAKELEIPIVEGAIAQDSIPTFTEAFLTSTIKEVVPIRRINNQEIPIGPVAQKLRNYFHEKNRALSSAF